MNKNVLKNFLKVIASELGGVGYVSWGEQKLQSEFADRQMQVSEEKIMAAKNFNSVHKFFP